MQQQPCSEWVDWEEIHSFAQEFELATLVFTDARGAFCSFMGVFGLEFNQQDQPVFCGQLPASLLNQAQPMQNALLIFQQQQQDSYFAAHIRCQLQACFSHLDSQISRVELHPQKAQIFHHIGAQVLADLAEQEQAEGLKMAELLSQ